MSTYRVVTVQKTVYVHNVVKVEPYDNYDPELIFYRAGGNSVTFLKANVISYEHVVNGGGA